MRVKMTDIKEKILNWLAHGRVGTSSKSMALCAAGLEQDRMWGVSTPSDPDDLNRCLLLLEQVPEVRDHFCNIAKLSPKWGTLIARWDEVEQCFIDEVGLNWCKGRSAPKTYKLMKEIGL